MFRAQLRLTLSQAAGRGFGISYDKEPNHIYAKEHKTLFANIIILARTGKIKTTTRVWKKKKGPNIKVAS